MGLGGVANAISTLGQQLLEQDALVKARSTNQKVVRRPFAAVVLSPGFAQPFTVGLKAPRCQHAGFGSDALLPDMGRYKLVTLHLDPVHRRVVANLDPQRLGTAVVGIDQGLATAHEKRIGTRQVQGARQRGLKAHTMASHPVAA